MVTEYDGIELRFDCDLDALGPLAARFVQLELDDEGRTAIDGLLAARHGRVPTTLHWMLRPFFSQFDVNAMLRMHPMHLLSTTQWRRLLGSHAGGRLLDIGAGSGDVTATLAPLFAETATTEVSRAMARRLRERGFRCHQIDVTARDVPGAPFDVVSCLNVIDRCARPRTLLEDARELLTDDGRLIVAVALPFEPFYYYGGKQLAPLERIDVEGKTWEAAARKLGEDVLPALGFEVDSLARSPYFSSGDVTLRIYGLDVAIAVCHPVD